MTIKICAAGNVMPDTLESFRMIKKSGLDGQELEFVRQAYMKVPAAQAAGKLARDLGLNLSIHASYFINLSSEDKEKIIASRQRILAACEIGHHLGAKEIVFHAGYYGTKSHEEIFEIIKKEIILLKEEISKNKWEVNISPETTGKKSQFGSLDELLILRKETGCSICIDFSHLLARDGKINYKKVVASLPQYFHAHYSGIEYTQKGERKHLLIDESDFSLLAKELCFAKKNAVIVCESPDPFGDAMKMKRIVDSLNK
ncbi:MAG: TIM barrel protein [archaeon]